MGWKGAIRSYNASVRRAERQSIRRQNERARQDRIQAKLHAIDQARYEVQEYENLIEQLTTLHHECETIISWKEIASVPEWQMPIDEKHNESDAIQKLNHYSPNFFLKVFKLENFQRSRLTKNVEAAKVLDGQIFERKVREFTEKHSLWKENKRLADSILAGDLSTYVEALRELKPFEGLGELGKTVEVKFVDPSICKAEIHVHDETIVPTESKSQLTSGKLSIKSLPRSKFYEIYQDHVCSSALRVANELFSILPLEIVVVTAVNHLLNPATGLLERQAILSVKIPRSTLQTLNLRQVDPSAALKNFVHAMDFSKTSGFIPVRPLADENGRAS